MSSADRDSQTMTPPTTEGVEPLSSLHTANFPALLRELGISVLVTTYQANMLVILREDGSPAVNTHFRTSYFQATA
jgi:hypothetical protein